jgi:hypothetical protein
MKKKNDEENIKNVTTTKMPHTSTSIYTRIYVLFFDDEIIIYKKREVKH